MQESFVSNAGLVFIGIYISALLLIGYLGKRASTENTLSDFYLAGREYGGFCIITNLICHTV